MQLEGLVVGGAEEVGAGSGASVAGEFPVFGVVVVRDGSERAGVGTVQEVGVEVGHVGGGVHGERWSAVRNRGDELRVGANAAHHVEHGAWSLGADADLAVGGHQLDVAVAPDLQIVGRREYGVVVVTRTPEVQCSLGTDAPVDAERLVCLRRADAHIAGGIRIRNVVGPGLADIHPI